jgi:hypothetical protein
VQASNKSKGLLSGACTAVCRVQLREQGWQLSPFMLSSTEKRRYLPL